MDKVLQFIIENAISGKIDKKIAAQVVKLIQEEKNQIDKDIAIIGIGVKMPLADGFKDFWHNLESGTDCIGEFPESRKKDTSQYLKSFGMENSVVYKNGAYLNEIDKFDYQFFKISPMEAGLMDPNQRLFLQTAWEAIEDAGYGERKLSGNRTGVYLGYSSDFSVEYKNVIAAMNPVPSSLAEPGNFRSIIASRISYTLDLKGPSILVDTACSSALTAVHLACQGIRNRECDMAIAGGVKINLFPIENGGSELGGISIESSDWRTKAFDDSSDGTGFGEGVAAILLKPLKKALMDRDSIYAVIKGSAVNQDGSSIGITAPNSLAKEDVIIKAWKDAGIDPETITYMEAHGTGTKLGDTIEIDGIENAFKKFTDKKQFCAVGSIKTNIGHLDSAAGISGLLKMVGALKYKKMPPSLHFNRPNHKICFEESPVYVNDCLKDWSTEGFPRRCGVSSFGIRGANCHIILEEAPLSEPMVDNAEKSRVQVLTLSAKSSESLNKLIERYTRFIKKETNVRLEDICYTANTGRGHYSYRLAILANDKADMLGKLEVLKDAEIKLNIKNGIFLGECKTASGSKRTSPVLKELVVKEGVEYRQLMLGICEAYVYGEDIVWEELYKGQACWRVHLPTYPFIQKRCWIENDQSSRFIETVDKKSEATGAEFNKTLKDVLLIGRCKEEGYNENEKLIGKIWSSVLGLSEININDDFFELGGNSLVTIHLETEFEKNDIPLSYQNIYEYRTIKKLAAYVENLNRGVIQGEYHKSSSGKDTPEFQKKPEEIFSAGENAVVSKGKSIQGIEPFNDIFFKSCFYNSLFPIIKLFCRDVIGIMVNDITVYITGRNPSEEKLEVAYIPCSKTETILQGMGISFEIKDKSKDIIRDIINAIDNNSPVIIWVDCFYESIRKEMYQKDHLVHTWLVYGYDSSECMFDIIEHKHRDNLYYEKRKISYQDTVNSYNGFLTNFFDKSGGHTFFKFYKDDASCSMKSNQKNEGYDKILVNNTRAQYQEILRGLEQMKAYSDTFKSVVLDESHLRSCIGSMVDGLNEIIKAKQIERYRVEKLFTLELELIGLLDSIIEHWNSIRKIAVKYMYSSIYIQSDFENLIGIPEIIYGLECCYNDKLLTYYQ